VTDSKTQSTMAAQAYIARLGERGIDYVFACLNTTVRPLGSIAQARRSPW
jgi:hypothetical protein